jgi:lipid II isoglutaminyl synthase (glutamine-hydrolysing)
MKLVIGWLYPQLMSTYGDRGNIITLQKRCWWRGIDAQVLSLDVGFKESEIEKCDLLFMGGAQDTQQKIVSEDLKNKSKVLLKLISAGLPGLYICGAYQFLGNYYKEADETKIQGLGILDLYTENPGLKHPRLIGNIIFDPKIQGEFGMQKIIGFENHGGRTYLGKNVKPFGFVIKGFGNNGEDETEGAIYKNTFGSYLHGPILPKNPEFADYLIKASLERKYNKKIKLKKIDGEMEQKARKTVAKGLNIDL